MAETDEDLQADVLGAPPQLPDDVWSRLITGAVEADPDEGSAALLPPQTDADDGTDSSDDFDITDSQFTPDDDSFDGQDDFSQHHHQDDPNHVDHDADDVDQ